MVSKLGSTRTIIGACIALALVALVSAALVFAQTQSAPGGQPGRVMRGAGPMGRGPGGIMGIGPTSWLGPRAMMGPGAFFGQLGLTDAQRAQIDKIRESHKEEAQALANESGPAREALRAAIRSNDTAAIQAAGTALASEIVKRALLAANVQAEVRGVLTDEQKARIEDLRAAAGERRQKLRGMHQGPPLF